MIGKYLKTNFNVNQIMICDEMIRDNSKCIDCGQLEKSVNSNNRGIENK